MIKLRLIQVCGLIAAILGCKTLDTSGPSESEYGLEGLTVLTGERQVYVAAEGLVIRDGNSPGANPCGSLANNAKISVTGINDPDWVLLTQFPQTALDGECKVGKYYVNSAYLTEAPNLDKTLEPSKRDGRALTFSRACESLDGKTKVTIGFVGDVLPHMPLQLQAINGDQQFSSHWRKVQQKISEPDFTYANFEGPSAPGIANSTYPSFNYPEFLVDNLKRDGFDIVSTANNHFFDKGVRGIDQTIENMNDSNMPFFGTKSSKDLAAPFYRITNITGQGGAMKVAWVACTFSNNFGTSSSIDPNKQALYCYRQNGGSGGSNPLLLKIVSDLASSPDVDAVVVTPHWGDEGVQRPGIRQSSLATDLADAGATAIIGAHPHVLQPWEKLNRNGREVFVHYSLGNFISNQGKPVQRASMILYVGFVKDQKGKVYVDGVRYLPMYMAHAKESSAQGRSHTLIPIETASKLDSIGTAARANIFSLLPENYRISMHERVVTNQLQCGG